MQKQHSLLVNNKGNPKRVLDGNDDNGDMNENAYKKLKKGMQGNCTFFRNVC